MQTATMWLQEQIFNSDWKNMSGEDKLKLFEQAKEMEKKEHEKIYDHAFNYGVTSSQTEISDEEIEESSPYNLGGGNYNPLANFHRYEGAKWYREQLEKKQ